MGTPDELRLMVRKRQSPRRMLHTLGVESVAVCLAQRWGADTDDARNAALLHDVTKEAPDQLNLMEEYDILPCIWQETVPNVYHALTGAAFAERLGYNSDVVSAVRWHVTGHAGMTLLEKIIYLADLAEPCRNGIPGLSELRGNLYKDHDRALLLGLRMSLRYVRERGRPEDRCSAEALRWIAERNPSLACGDEYRE
ncbi:MAG: bis(5'-nucleosyl)-tetraphosphatase (symmetrical) YqeK [Oscillospiraceae bacterium]|jgi:nicotinate-nucleotide adenylyltransferase|nr:bis(5'-nucleosyl)-tetraphosphatase (symmetrical) YqeK [Oscillospiraceae bacterium]